MHSMNLLLSFLLICFPSGSLSEFWRRRWHSSVIARDWLYIDGGQIYDSAQGHWTQETSTIGIDLSKDWTNSSVTLVRTERPVSSYSNQALWFDNGGNIIYCFGGFTPIGYPNTAPAVDSVFGFTPDGNGGGSWKEVIGFVGEKPFPLEIHGVSSGIFASDNSDAYYLGGFISNRTSPTASLEYPNTGLLQLNFETLTLTNSSELGFPIKSGASLNVPGYGAEGVLVAFGGENWPDQGVGLNIINIFDKTKREWHYQIAKGDIPRPRYIFCAVGVQGQGHTSYEIIIHGGVDDYKWGSEGSKFYEVYVLSLPAFRWFRANSTSASPRDALTCHATKTRQMIIIGGPNPFNFTNNSDRPVKDPWDHGLAVFDMTALEFRDSYHSEADPYEPSYVIQQWYDNHDNKYPSSWTSSAVQKLFQDATTNSTNSTGSSTLSISPSSASPQSHSRLSHGTLAGLIVGWTTATLLCTVVFTYLIMKRRRQRGGKRGTFADSKTASPLSYITQAPPHELGAEQAPLEIMTERNDQAPFEIMNPRIDRAELSDQGIYEKP